MAATPSGETCELDEIEEEYIADFSHQLHPNGISSISWEGMEKSKSEILELDLTHNNLANTKGIEDFTKLKRVCFRQNLLTQIEPLGECSHTLQSLDYYLNNLHCLAEGLDYPKLLNFDASYNKIKDLRGLERWTTLRTLYLACNRIDTLSSDIFTCLKNLRTLELGNNRLREIGPALSDLPLLEELFLGKNKITQISGLSHLTNLRRLDLQSNRITAIGDGLRSLTNLRELYLNHNGLQEIDDGLASLVQLTCLDLSANMLTHLQNLSTLTLLNDFWCSSNKLASFHEVEALSHAQSIETVYFEHNPFSNDPQYRSRLSLLLPSLTQIDATPAFPQLSPLVRVTRLLNQTSTPSTTDSSSTSTTDTSSTSTTDSSSTSTLEQEKESS